MRTAAIPKENDAINSGADSAKEAKSLRYQSSWVRLSGKSEKRIEMLKSAARLKKDAENSMDK
jgi:hypothetical protein